MTAVEPSTRPSLRLVGDPWPRCTAGCRSRLNGFPSRPCATCTNRAANEKWEKNHG